MKKTCLVISARLVLFGTCLTSQGMQVSTPLSSKEEYNTQWTAYQKAACDGKIAQLLELTKSFNPAEEQQCLNAKDFEGKTALALACQEGQLASAAFLIARGADINAQDNQGKTILHAAAYSANMEVIALLINELGLNVNAQDLRGNTLLHDLSRQNNVFNNTTVPLHDARAKSIKQLIRYYNANPFIKNKEGKTPEDTAHENRFAKAILSYNKMYW